jgi:hypothetical protein
MANLIGIITAWIICGIISEITGLHALFLALAFLITWFYILDSAKTVNKRRPKK